MFMKNKYTRGDTMKYYHIFGIRKRVEKNFKLRLYMDFYLSYTDEDIEKSKRLEDLFAQISKDKE